MPSYNFQPAGCTPHTYAIHVVASAPDGETTVAQIQDEIEAAVGVGLGLRMEALMMQVTAENQSNQVAPVVAVGEGRKLPLEELVRFYNLMHPAESPLPAATRLVDDLENNGGGVNGISNVSDVIATINEIHQLAMGLAYLKAAMLPQNADDLNAMPALFIQRAIDIMEGKDA